MTLARIFPLGSLDYSKPTTVFLMVETGTLYEVGEKSEVSPEETRKNFSCSIDHTRLLRSLLDHGRIVKPKGSRVRSGFKFKLCNPLSCHLEGLSFPLRIHWKPEWIQHPIPRRVHCGMFEKLIELYLTLNRQNVLFLYFSTSQSKEISLDPFQSTKEQEG